MRIRVYAWSNESPQQVKQWTHASPLSHPKGLLARLGVCPCRKTYYPKYVTVAVGHSSISILVVVHPPTALVGWRYCQQHQHALSHQHCQNICFEVYFKMCSWKGQHVQIHATFLRVLICCLIHHTSNVNARALVNMGQGGKCCVYESPVEFIPDNNTITRASQSIQWEDNKTIAGLSSVPTTSATVTLLSVTETPPTTTSSVQITTAKEHIGGIVIAVICGVCLIIFFVGKAALNLCTASETIPSPPTEEHQELMLQHSSTSSYPTEESFCTLEETTTPINACHKPASRKAAVYEWFHTLFPPILQASLSRSRLDFIMQACSRYDGAHPPLWKDSQTTLAFKCVRCQPTKDRNYLPGWIMGIVALCLGKVRSRYVTFD